jgi:ABC-type transport system substrate-binding protein
VPEIDKLYEQQKFIADPEERKKVIWEMDKLAMNDAAYLILHWFDLYHCGGILSKAGLLRLIFVVPMPGWTTSGWIFQSCRIPGSGWARHAAVWVWPSPVSGGGKRLTGAGPVN